MTSVLNPINHQPVDGKNFPLFQDLNIDQIIDHITEDWGEETKELFYKLPVEIEAERYRKDFFYEMVSLNLVETFDSFLQLMNYRSICSKNALDVEEKIQKQVWFLKETDAYVKAVELMASMYESNEFTSEAFLSLKKKLDEYRGSKYYKDLLEASEEYMAKLLGFRLGLIYENDRITLTLGEGKCEYEDKLKALFPKSDYSIKSPFVSELDMSYLESKVIDLFKKKNKDFFLDVSAYNKVFKDYLDENFLLLEKEIKYYLSFYKFMKKMEGKGFSFTRPSWDFEKITAEGLYDLALACASLENNKEVVDNSISMLEGERFLVLTGPNQGGKTTFARSLGQMVYFSKMGLYVPAKVASLPSFENILTHFSVEESVESGKGKLMDELTRLKPMMEEKHSSAFVVINELFTTAANYDAVEMGKKVLQFFTGKDCRGIYVTHLGELASCCEGLVSLRAMVDGENHQTFKVARGDYEDFTGTNGLVAKYGLSYEKIMERLS